VTTALRNGLLVALVHVAIVGGVGGKLLIDRATYPRAWTRTAPVDPDLPIRGRYVRLRLEAAIGDGLVLAPPVQSGELERHGSTPPFQPARLTARDGELVAVPDVSASPAVNVRLGSRPDSRVAEIVTPVALFIPEGVEDPSIRPPGEELWAEVTIPPNGAPRPIRLGVRRDGVLTPLDLR
jgi:hypothetical protein